MGKIFALPSAPAAPADVQPFSLWDVQRGSSTGSDAPRDASHEETRRYLLWIAARRGVLVPVNATFAADGITADKRLIVAMPGFGQSQTVTCELLDEAGNVVRTMPLPVDRRGKLPFNAAQAQEWTGLKPVRKPRKAAAKPAKAPKPEVAPTEAPAVSGDVAALVAAVTMLSARVAGLESTLEGVRAGRRVRSTAERRAIVRAWRMRRDSRARADLDRRALEAANGAYRGAVEALGASNGERDQARAALNVAARVAACDAEERARLASEVTRLATARPRTARQLARLRSTCAAQSAELVHLRPLGAAISALANRAAFTPPIRSTGRPALAAVA